MHEMSELLAALITLLSESNGLGADLAFRSIQGVVFQGFIDNLPNCTTDKDKNCRFKTKHVQCCHNCVLFILMGSAMQ